MAKKRAHEEHENHERWLVSYADFITLLFAFFTVLYATSEQNVKKEKEFEQSIRKYMTGAAGGGMASSSFPTLSDNAAMIEPPIPKFPNPGADSESLERVIGKLLKDRLSDEEYDRLVSDIHSDALGVRIELQAASLFDSGSADLKSKNLAGLGKLASVLRASKRRIIVEGHTDDQPIATSAYPSNWELASMRATKMVRYLIHSHHFDASLLSAVSYGDQRPVKPNTSEDNRAKNRRIEILVMNKDIGI